MTRRITPGVAYGLLAVGAAAVSMLVSWTALAAQFDNNVYDFIFRVRPTERADAGAVLLAFDERTLHRYGGIAGMRPALTQALDQIEDLLIRLGRSKLDLGTIRDAQGAVRVLAPFPTWEDFLRLAFDEIRYCGATSVQVMRRMNALIKNLLTVLPSERHAALRHWEERLGDTVERTFKDAEEQQDASVADRQGLGIGESKSENAK